MIDYATVTRTRRKWTRFGLGIFTDLLELERDNVAAAGIDAVDPELWRQALWTVWSGAASDSSNYTAAAIAEKGLADLDHEELARITQARAGQITATSRDALLELAAISPEDFAPELYSEWLGARVNTIAEAEAVASVAWGQAVTAAGDRGLDHIWHTQGDDRVRRTHQEANRQRRPIDEPFTVGGAALRFPADPFGPAQEVINCRCWENYRRRSRG